jgi:hypothetical protein
MLSASSVPTDTPRKSSSIGAVCINLNIWPRAAKRSKHNASAWRYSASVLPASIAHTLAVRRFRLRGLRPSEQLKPALKFFSKYESQLLPWIAHFRFCPFCQKACLRWVKDYLKSNHTHLQLQKQKTLGLIA